MEKKLNNKVSIKKRFILNTITAWDEPPRSRHQVAKALLPYGDVYFITRNRVGIPKIQLKEHEDINFIIPTWPFDYRLRYHLPVVNELYQKYLLSRLKNYLLEDSIFITFDHTSHILTKNIDRSIYYCTDHHIGNSKLSNMLINSYHHHTEEKVAFNSVLCIGSSHYLKNKLIKYNSNTHLIPLGAPKVDSKIVKYSKNSAKQKIKLCYVGFMQNRRIDIDIVRNIINSEDFELHVIGVLDEIFQKLLEGKANIMGVLLNDELYSAIQGMDVCILPYDPKGVNKGGTPNKYWLYTACGKPSVSIELENIKQWPQNDGLLYIAEKHNFNEIIYKAYSEDSKEKFENRVNYAKQNTWDKRIEKFISLI